jgi:hypothetical protein
MDLMNAHTGIIQINETGTAQLIDFNDDNWKPLVDIPASGAIKSRSICAYVKAHGFKEEKVQKLLDPGQVSFMTFITILC